jgi:hypothetical protein
MKEQANYPAAGWRKFILDPVPRETVIRDKEAWKAGLQSARAPYQSYTENNFTDALKKCKIAIKEFKQGIGTSEPSNPYGIDQREAMLALASVLACLLRAAIRKGTKYHSVATEAIACLDQINRKVFYGSLDEEIVLGTALLTKDEWLAVLLRARGIGQQAPKSSAKLHSIGLVGTVFLLLEQGLKLRNLVLQYTTHNITRHYYGNLRQILVQLLANDYSCHWQEPRAELLIRMAKAFLREIPEQMRTTDHYRYRYTALELFCFCLAPDQTPESEIKALILADTYPPEGQVIDIDKDSYRRLIGSYNKLICLAALQRTTGWYDQNYARDVSLNFKKYANCHTNQAEILVGNEKQVISKMSEILSDFDVENQSPSPTQLILDQETKETGLPLILL